MKHAKKNLFGLITIAVAILALAAVPFFTQLNAQNANADELSPQECDTLSNAKTTIEDDILACYQAFGKAQNYGYGFNMISEIMSGECLAGGGVNDGQRAQIIDRFDKTLTRDNKDLFNTEWVNYYDTIRLCNKFIEKYPENPENISYVAEAYGLRGLCYFDLVRLFGNIPLVLKSTDVPNVQANPKEVVFPQIMSDLYYSFKISNFYTKYTSKTYARLNRAAAGGFLARAFCFYQGFYNGINELASGCPNVTLVSPCPEQSLSQADVVAVLKAVVESGTYKLTEYYQSNWESAIIEPRYNGYIDDAPSKEEMKEASSYEELFGELNSESGCHDEEQIFSIVYNSNTYSDSKNNFQNLQGPRLATQAFRQKGFGMLPVSTAFDREWDNAEKSGGYTDIRHRASNLNLDWECSDLFGIEKTWDKNLKDWRECTGLINGKYGPICYWNGDATNFAQNYIILRYADLLLMITELTGDPQYMNQIQRRAGVPETPYNLDALKREREFEFAFEGINYWDQLRWDYTKNLVFKKIMGYEDGINVWNGDPDQQVPIKFDPQKFWEKEYLPIPETQIAKYHYTQNKGWE